MNCSCAQCWGELPVPQPLVRLRLKDGGYVYMEWHRYLGPVFYRDRRGMRELVTSCMDETLFWAFDWWHSRGKRG